jgi:3-phenylpropionate/trans-cinnamate dioxygenase ferredoxin reductase subunit
VRDGKSYVIVGAGLAGAKAAETLRDRGFDGRITLIGSDLELPYERPPLSKAYLAGTSPRADAFVHPDGFYAEQDIDVLTSTIATALDASARRVHLSDGAGIVYDRLLIATGALPRRPRIPGAALDGVHLLRTVADADALRRALTAGARVTVVGAGWIGCEVAATARALGADVTLIERAGAPLERVLGPTLGAFFAQVHREHGVDVATSAGVEAIEGRGRVEGIRLSNGRRIECDAVVLGVGVAPDTTLAASGGLEIDDGIVVDDRLRTSVPDVFAAGDVASAYHSRYGRHLRVEHWANALNQGIAAAASMLDHGEPYARLPYFFSDQYDLGMEYIGRHEPDDRLVVHGEPDDGAFEAFWLGGDDRVTAGLHVNRWGAIDEIRELIERGASLPSEMSN